MRILLVINPASGNKDKKQSATFLSQQLKERHIEHDFFWTRADSFESGELSSQLKKPYSTVFVLGGDGTINQVVNSLQDFQTPLALFPMGSGNDFARNFMLPKQLDEQLKLALSNQTTQTDLFSCNDRLFVNGVGIGFDGRVAQQMLNRKKRGEMAYMYLVIKTLLNYNNQTIEIHSPTLSYKGNSFMLTVATGRYFGGFCLTPGASLNDSLLDMSLVEGLPLWKRAFLIASFKKGKHTGLPYIQYRQASSIEVFSDNIPAHIDGEYAGAGMFAFRNSHQKLLVKAALRY